MLEYVLALAGLMVIFSIMFGLVTVTRKYAVRTENIVACEYP